MIEEPLLQLAIMWIGVFFASLLASKTKLTSVLYFLFIGALLVNLGVLPTETAPFIRGVAELGIILIMFALGFEENTRNFIRSVKRSWGIAFFGGLAPFLTAYSVADYFWDDINISLICGLTMTATAVSLTMVSLKSLGLQRSKAATGIMTSAVLDDVASLALVAVMVPIAAGQAEPTLLGVSITMGKAIGFFIAIALVSAYLLPHDLTGWVAKIPVIGKYGARDLIAAEGGEHSTLTILLFALLVGLLAHELGFHPAVGAYMAGLILHEEYFLFHPENVRGSHRRTKTIIDTAAFSWIGPIFFVDLGTKIVFDGDILVSIIPHILTLFISLFFAQIISAGLAARYTGKFSFHESMLIGFGMLGRAELAFVVMDIAYIQNNILSTEAFYTLMGAAFWLNIAVPICITWWKPHYDKAEQTRKSGVHLPP